VSPTALGDAWNSLIKHKFGFGKFLDLGFPVGTEFVVHLVEEELLLSSLATEDIIHVQTRLLHNLIEKIELHSVCVFMVLLELLHRFNLLLLFDALVTLGDLLLDLLSDLDEAVVTLLHPLLLHEELILDLLHVLRVLRGLQHQ
jgi:hypothetical protein